MGHDYEGDGAGSQPNASQYQAAQNLEEQLGGINLDGVLQQGPVSKSYGLDQGERRVTKSEHDARQEDGMKPRSGKVQDGRQKQDAEHDFFGRCGGKQNRGSKCLVARRKDIGS